jgi:tetratricopeptide (TPR) repeat protein
MSAFGPAALFFTCLLFWGSSTPVRAENTAQAAQLVEQGNLAYQQGKYQAAVTAYTEATSEGADNGHVYFNLGNAYYRLKDFGHAIASYRRALLRLPADPDITASLNLARRQAKDKIEEPPGLANSVWNKLAAYYPALSRYQMERIFLILYCGGWLTFLFYSLSQRPRAKSLSFFLLFTSACWALLTFGVQPGRDGSPRPSFAAEADDVPGVILAAECQVYSGNAESFQVVFVLHAGAEVMTGEQRDGWVEVILPDGRKGWVHSTEIERIMA